MATLVQMLVPIGLSLGCLTSQLAADGPDEPPSISYTTYECPEGWFRCEIPAGWAMIRDERSEARIHYHGIYVFPAGEQEIRPRLMIDYYAPDNSLFKGIDSYLERQLKPWIKLPDEKVSPVREVVVNGRRGRAFTRENVEAYPPESMDAERVPVRHECVVVSHRTGFIVIKFSSPIQSYDRWRPVFDHCLKKLTLLPATESIVVRAHVPDRSAEEIESKLTNPLEALLGKLTASSSIRSISRDNDCLVRAELQPGADAESLRQIVGEKIRDSAVVPEGGSVECHIDFDTSVLLISLWSRDTERPRGVVLRELTALSGRHLQDRLKTVPGVAEAEMIVSVTERLEVKPAPDRLASAKMGISDLHEILLEFGSTAHFSPNVLEDLRQTICVTRDEKPVRVMDVADVYRRELQSSNSVFWQRDISTGDPFSAPAVILAVRTSTSHDSAAVFRAVRRLLDELRSDLPPGIHLEEHTAGPYDAWIVMPSANDQDPVSTSATNAAKPDQTMSEIAQLSGVQSIWPCRITSDPLESSLRNHEFLVVTHSIDAEAREELTQQILALAGADAVVTDTQFMHAAWPPFPGRPNHLRLSVRGSDMVILKNLADALSERLMMLQGIRNLTMTPTAYEEAPEITLDDDRIDRFALKKPDLDALVRRILNPQPLCTFDLLNEGGPMELVMTFMDEDRSDFSELIRMPLSAPDGATVRLEDVASVFSVSRPKTIFRADGQRVLFLDFRRTAPAAENFDTKLQTAIESMDLPSGYTITQENQPGR